jgi:3-isopropylmalate dehydrogenase
MMVEELKEESAGKRIEKAVMKVLAHDIKSVSAGQMGHTTSEIGDLVVKYVAEEKKRVSS